METSLSNDGGYKELPTSVLENGNGVNGKPNGEFRHRFVSTRVSFIAKLYKKGKNNY